VLFDLEDTPFENLTSFRSMCVDSDCAVFEYVYQQAMGQNMKKLPFVLSSIALAFLLTTAVADAQTKELNTGLVRLSSPSVFPTLTGENLNDKEFTLPQDLPAERTLVMFAFEHAQQPTLNSWSKGLDLANSHIPWVEVPVISTPYVIGSFMIESGMRKGITDPKVRERVITLYTDTEDFSESMGFEFDEHGAYVAVVDRTGQNLGTVKGPYDQSKAKILLRLLGLR